jgi:hypothetical protein
MAGPGVIRCGREFNDIHVRISEWDLLRGVDTRALGPATGAI